MGAEHAAGAVPAHAPHWLWLWDARRLRSYTCLLPLCSTAAMVLGLASIKMDTLSPCKRLMRSITVAAAARYVSRLGVHHQAATPTQSTMTACPKHVQFHDKQPSPSLRTLTGTPPPAAARRSLHMQFRPSASTWSSSRWSAGARPPAARAEWRLPSAMAPSSPPPTPSLWCVRHIQFHCELALHHASVVITPQAQSACTLSMHTENMCGRQVHGCLHMHRPHIATLRAQRTCFTQIRASRRSL